MFFFLFASASQRVVVCVLTFEEQCSKKCQHDGVTDYEKNNEVQDCDRSAEFTVGTQSPHIKVHVIVPVFCYDHDKNSDESVKNIVKIYPWPRQSIALLKGILNISLTKHWSALSVLIHRKSEQFHSKQGKNKQH